MIADNLSASYIRPMPRVFSGHFKDLGDGFHVLRILPHLEARAVGPFVFVDHFGPAAIKTGDELMVRPHPHIGLSTITYLYSGVIRHRDSLGTELPIRPGEVNWMTAGRGIVHSEHSLLEADQNTIEGIQTWVALPVEHEETEPAFDHYGADVIPVLAGAGYEIRLIAGSLMGKTSPVKTHSQLFYADVQTDSATTIDLQLPAGQEGALYVSQGSFTVDGLEAKVGSMIVFDSASEVRLISPSAARGVLLGGKKHAEARHLWWNFVSSSKDRIEKAKADWKANTMGIVPHETDRIPLPEK
jgi:redox-sensitive bicupin YhaK (pirin superfamily)